MGLHSSAIVVQCFTQAIVVQISSSRVLSDRKNERIRDDSSYRRVSAGQRLQTPSSQYKEQQEMSARFHGGYLQVVEADLQAFAKCREA